MAVVKSPALSLDASGNLAGICYSKWRGMNIARGAWTGTVPNTGKQVVIQGYMTTISKAWSGTLTEKQREQWRAVARSLVRISRGLKTYIPSGYQYFMEVNFVRLRLLLALMTEPHEGVPESSIGEVVVEYNLGMMWVDILLTEVLNPPGLLFYTEVWRAGPYDNGGRRAIAGEYRFIDKWFLLVNGKDQTTDPGKYYWYKVRWLWIYGATGNWFERQVYTA